MSWSEIESLRPEWAVARRRAWEILSKLSHRTPKKLVKIGEKVSMQSRAFLINRLLTFKYPNVKIVIPSVDWVRHKIVMIPKSLNFLANLRIGPEAFRDSNIVWTVRNGVKIPLFTAQIGNHLIVSDIPFIYTIVRISETTKILLLWNYHQEPMRLQIYNMDHGTVDSVEVPPDHFLIFIHEGLILMPFVKMMKRLEEAGLSRETLKTIEKFYKSHGYKTPQYLYSRLEKRQLKNAVVYMLMSEVKPRLERVVEVCEKVFNTVTSPLYNPEIYRLVKASVESIYRPLETYLNAGHEPPRPSVETSIRRLLELLPNLEKLGIEEVNTLLGEVRRVLAQYSNTINRLMIEEV